MNWTTIAATFATVFLAELPDKTMVTSLILTATSRRPLAVWVGVAAAFVMHVALAVVAGGLISELPERPVKAAAGLLFAIGAAMMWRTRDQLDHGEGVGTGGSARKVMATSFVALGLAEFGDLTQLSVAGLAASTGRPLSVAIGGLGALWAVAAIAVTVGAAVIARVSLRTVRTVAALVFASLAVLAFGAAAL
jgi:Ca2+/H+ antiporter, TMEM165/GDT1 family